ncbi:MAG: DUF1028 domain-containing protein [Planctomycetes bacterium]|nr:DUF1028 domain-containing protein [Planctomycetota bacterium]
MTALASCTAPRGQEGSVVATFSIVAVDPDTGELGIAVQSKFIAVGAVVPWAKAGVGAVATQAWANTTYGPRTLEMLAKGETPEDVVRKLTESDRQADRRQVGIVSAKGESATFTGKACQPWAGGVKGENYCCQGNILAGEDVVQEMEKAFRDAEGELADRLLAALEAGQAAGGDRRGMQSAALLVVREGWGYGGLNDRFRDLRVDDHAEPIQELKRILKQHKKLFPRPNR